MAELLTIEQRAILYCKSRSISIEEESPGVLATLGSGTDGTVYSIADIKTALKIFHKDSVYQNELECYRRLADRKVTEIQGFSVPELRDFSDEFLAIEITIVEPPRILDFGKVSLDDPGDFSEATMAYWLEQQEELWGDHWPTIRRILARLESMGIFYRDPNPYNITPENWDPEI